MNTDGTVIRWIWKECYCDHGQCYEVDLNADSEPKEQMEEQDKHHKEQMAEQEKKHEEHLSQLC